MQRVRQGELRPEQPPAHQLLDALRRRRRPTGTLPATTASGRTSSRARRPRTQSNKTRGFEQPQNSYARQRRLHADELVAPQRARRALRRQLQGHGHPARSPAYTYQTVELGLGYPIPADLRRRPSSFQNTPRVQINELRSHQARLRATSTTTRRSTPAASTASRAASASSTRSTTSTLAYPGGGYVDVCWDRSFTSHATGRTDRGTVRLLRGERPRHARQGRREHLSLYVQDQWTLGNRLTLNLGLRTEHETIPSFRPDIQDIAFEFGFGDKLAPRLGASYDVFGDGRFKVFGSWGRYYDWTKYELARGSFGGDIWHVYYRSLDTTDVFSLSGDEHAGPQPLDRRARQLPRSPRAELRHDRSEHQADVPGQHSTSGIEYQLEPEHGVHGATTCTTTCGARSRTSACSRTATRSTVRQPRRGHRDDDERRRGLTAVVPDAEAEAAVRRARADARHAASRRTGSAARATCYSRLYGNYAGLANSDEITTPTTNRHIGDGAAAGRQHRAPGQQRQPRVGPRRARVGFARQPRRARPPGHRSAARREAVRLVHAAVRHAGRRVLLRRQRHAGQHVRCQTHQPASRCSWTAAATWAARRS